MKYEILLPDCAKQIDIKIEQVSLPKGVSIGVIAVSVPVSQTPAVITCSVVAATKTSG